MDEETWRQINEQEERLTGARRRTPEEWAEQHARYERVRRANRAAESCGKCGRAVGTNEPVYTTNLQVGYRQRWHTVVCEGCAPEYARQPEDFYDRGVRYTLYRKEPCQQCGRPVVWVHYADSRRHWCCSEVCMYRYYNRLRSERSAAARAGRSCDQCSEEFDAVRSDQRYCSPACRQRAYRQRATHSTA